MNAADLYCNIPKFYDSLNTVVIMQKMNQKVLLSNNAKGRYWHNYIIELPFTTVDKKSDYW